MCEATYVTARRYTCPAGHGAEMIVPVGADLSPRCAQCRQPMAPGAEVLTGAWRVRECCTPAGPNGTWAGPPRDAARCRHCFGTKREATCLRCWCTNCDGDHKGECLACDATGTEDCQACDGEGWVFDEHDERAGRCPARGCRDGRVACGECGGSGRDARAA